MRQLNRDAADALHDAPAGAVRACTDVTGFGLVGHGAEMAAASGVTLGLDTTAIPALPHARELVLANRPGGAVSNERHFGGLLASAAPVDPALRALLFDPQTSGGLLAAVTPSTVDRVLAALAARGVRAVVVGRVRERVPGVAVRLE
jgi:selenide,water dikinase